MSLVPGWHTSIIAPYFVVGAVHSGLGMVAIGLYLVRRTYRLETYIRLEHFDKLGKLHGRDDLDLGISLFSRPVDGVVRQESQTIWPSSHSVMSESVCCSTLDDDTY